jgi:hypothetical protein
MAKKKKNGGTPDLPNTQQERYPGSDVLGMELTTAKPLHWATGADPEIPLPGKPWPHSLYWDATVKGKKVKI